MVLGYKRSQKRARRNKHNSSHRNRQNLQTNLDFELQGKEGPRNVETSAHKTGGSMHISKWLQSRPQASHKSPKPKQTFHDEKRLYYEVEVFSGDFDC
jgi:hypothetical protein